MYVGTIFLLFVIFVIGKASFGSARWLNAGIVNIQPSEIAKIVIILVLSEYFAHTWDQPHNLKWIFKSLLITLGVVIWIVLQPNLSTSIVIVVLWFALIWISRLPMKYVFTFTLVAVVVGLSVFPHFWLTTSKRESLLLSRRIQMSAMATITMWIKPKLQLDQVAFWVKGMGMGHRFNLDF